MTLAIQIDAASAVPVHRQIYEAWRRGILMGRFVAGGRVPSTRELAGTLAISRSTVSQAYDQLVSEGYLEAVREPSCAENCPTDLCGAIGWTAGNPRPRAA
jgi:GntR family transcriptional regulator/MocR family aminotransferase